MRIGLVSPYSLSHPGGVNTHVLGLADELVRRGHVVRVLAPCDGPPPSTLVDPVGPSFPITANGSVARLALSPRAVAVAARWPARRRLDLVHVHEPLSPLTSLVITATSAAPLVGTFHAAADRWWPYERAGRPLGHVVDRLSVRTAVSDAAEALASRYFPGEYRRTPNGLDVARYDRAAPDPDAPSVLFVGRNEPRKGADTVVAAARLLDADVGIVGPGYEGSALADAAPDNVRFLGPRPHALLPGLLKGARVVCQPAARGESFGFVVLEAMAASRPVVVSDIPGYAAVVGDAGVVVPPGDPDALATAVRGLLADPGDWGVRARARAEQFSWARLADAVEEVYALAV